ncbi:MAG TPA: hypothetical protein VK601_04205 [Kofleriaceae bacterium]|nr:hypothetical protein [Kofleriaceae bacterium]
MKHNVLVAVVFVVGCATGGVASQLVVPPIHAGTAPTRWEYLCTQASAVTSSLTAHLNQVGAQGWDLVSAAPLVSEVAGTGGTQSVVFCFRRGL